MNSSFQTEIIRSRRKTFSVQIKGNRLLVKVPLGAGDREIADFLKKHERWIVTHLEKAQASQQKAAEAGLLSMEEIRALADQALQVIPERVRYYAPLMGVTYGRITIRNQRSRWGSCTSKGNLNFNCLLMLCPPEVVDSVVVHELAHRLESLRPVLCPGAPGLSGISEMGQMAERERPCPDAAHDRIRFSFPYSGTE